MSTTLLDVQAVRRRFSSLQGDFVFLDAPGGSQVPDEVVLSTKTFNPMEEGADHGLRPARVRRQLESSLRRLGVERVPMFLTHAWDDDVPIAETAGVLDELRAEGKLGAYGLSNVDATELRAALDVGDFGWVQNSYSLLDREDEQEVLPLCSELGLGFTPFSPLAGGWLTGKYRRSEALPEGSRMTMRPEPYEHLRDDRIFDALEALERLAVTSGTTPAALALAWLLANPQVTAVVVGPRRPEHLEPALAALGAEIHRETIERLFEPA
jgi:aryl-alcohol dehydrogenase-like predicted oxidoreductase